MNIYSGTDFLHSWTVPLWPLAWLLQLKVKTGFLMSGLLFVVLQSIWHSDCKVTRNSMGLWRPAVWPGSLLHNYIKAWSTAQLQHTSYKYHDAPSLHSSSSSSLSPPVFFLWCTLTPPFIPVFIATCMKKPWTNLPSLTCYVKMHVCVSGFDCCCTIYTEGWSVVKFFLFPFLSSWTWAVSLSL